MSGIEIHKEPDYAYRLSFPVAPTMTWDVGDPVQLSTNQLSDCPDDADEIHISEIIGFACEPAEGIHAGSRATATADGFGVVEGTQRTCWTFDAPGLLLRTKNFWAAGGFAAAGNADKDYDLIGDLVVLAGINGTNVWGFEEEAPTAGTDAEFQIVDILDEDMNPIALDGTVDAGTGWIIVRPVRGLLSQLTEGGA